MVRKRQSGLWTPIAGHLDKFDTSAKRHALRELREETGIEETQLASSLMLYDVVYVPTGTKTSVGIVFVGTLKEKMGNEGWRVDDNAEIDMVKAWRLRDLWDWVEARRTDIYKPEFNRVTIKSFIEHIKSPYDL